MTYINHYCSVPATPEGIDMLENHLKAGNQAAICGWLSLAMAFRRR